MQIYGKNSQGGHPTMATIKKPKQDEKDLFSAPKKDQINKNSTPAKNSCCQPHATFSTAKQEPCDKENADMAKKKTQTTRILVNFDCGFSNSLFVRGEGISGLSWDKGTPLKNVKADQWVFETDKPFAKAQIKILLNDKQYEAGDNHKVDCGSNVVFRPKF